jgi:ribonuclease HI
VTWCNVVAAGASCSRLEAGKKEKRVKLVDNSERPTKLERAVIRADGASLGNPGPSAIGATIKDEQGRLIASISKPIGRATNNQAEYRAVIAALEEAIRLGVSQADIYLDSELIVRQLNGRYRVKNAALKPLYQRAKQMLGHLESFTINHIPRQQNMEADRLANNAL